MPPVEIAVISPMLVLGRRGEGSVNTNKTDNMVNTSVAPYIIVG